MFTCTHIDHVGINTNDMEATLQVLLWRTGHALVRTTRTGDGRRHYNVEIGGGNAFAVFDGAELRRWASANTSTIWRCGSDAGRI